MFCPQCGTRNDDDARFCQECGAALTATTPRRTTPPPPPPPHAAAPPPPRPPSEAGLYAGLMLRGAAFLIDAIVVNALVGLPVSLAIPALDIDPAQDQWIWEYGLQQPFMALMDAGVIRSPEGFLALVLALLTVAFVWLYFALFESSSLQGTPGKLVVGLKVTTRGGRRVSFVRATLRHFGKILSVLPLFFGYLLIALTPKKQGLHDMIAGCLVVHRRCASEKGSRD